MSAPAHDTLRGPACWPSLAVAATGMPGPLASVWAEGLGTVPRLGALGRALGTVGVMVHLTPEVLRGGGPRSQGSPQGSVDIKGTVHSAASRQLCVSAGVQRRMANSISRGSPAGVSAISRDLQERVCPACGAGVCW